METREHLFRAALPVSHDFAEQCFEPLALRSDLYRQIGNETLHAQAEVEPAGFLRTEEADVRAMGILVKLELLFRDDHTEPVLAHVWTQHLHQGVAQSIMPTCISRHVNEFYVNKLVVDGERIGKLLEFIDGEARRDRHAFILTCSCSP